MGKKSYDKKRPGGSPKPSTPRAGAAGRKPSGSGSFGGKSRGTRHRSDTGTSSSSVHDGIRILVVGVATGAVLLVGTPLAYVVYGWVAGS